MSFAKMFKLCKWHGSIVRLLLSHSVVAKLFTDCVSVLHNFHPQSCWYVFSSMFWDLLSALLQNNPCVSGSLFKGTRDICNFNCPKLDYFLRCIIYQTIISIEVAFYSFLVFNVYIFIFSVVRWRKFVRPQMFVHSCFIESSCLLKLPFVII